MEQDQKPEEKPEKPSEAEKSNTAGVTTPKSGEKKTEKSIPYDRFSEVNDKYKDAVTELNNLKAEKDKEENQKLANQKKFEELANKREGRIKELEGEIKNSKMYVQFADLATKVGVVSIADAFKLADLSKVELKDTGEVVGMEKVIDRLQKEKPFLFGKEGTGAIGSAINPGPGGQPQFTQDGKRIYQEEEFDDQKFYSEHKDDIAKAYLEGRVIKRKTPKQLY